MSAEHPSRVTFVYLPDGRVGLAIEMPEDTSQLAAESVSARARKLVDGPVVVVLGSGFGGNTEIRVVQAEQGLVDVPQLGLGCPVCGKSAYISWQDREQLYKWVCDDKGHEGPLLAGTTTA